ncbi:MAG TPA: AMP-binding protein [Ramlibacter sp.]|nr:AMP-binding protein [Ramlibacter sp.]
MSPAAAARPADFDDFAASLLPPQPLWPVFDFSAPHLRHDPGPLNLSVALLDSAVAQGHGGDVMLYCGDAAWTYAQLLDRVRRIARVLADNLKVRPGQCVMLRSGNSPMLAACWLAVVRVGAIAVACSPMLRSQELAFIVDKLRIRCALCEASVAAELHPLLGNPWLESVTCFTPFGERAGDAQLDALLARAEPVPRWTETAADDIAAVVFSSGTTGTPKAVAHSHRNLLAACDCWRHPVPIAPGEVMCATSAMAFTYGLTSNLLYPLRFRASAVLLPKTTPELLLGAIERHRITALCTVPTVLHKLLPYLRDREMPTLAKYFSSGEALGPDLWHAWHAATGHRIVEGFGSSELVTRVLSPTAMGEPVGSVGKAVPGYTACILDEEDRVVPPGGRGFLGIRGPTGCRYLGDEERQRAFVRSGWNVTADVFEQDRDGCFWYVGRKDDIIVSSGYNIAAPEVERAIASHPSVLECAVVGVSDRDRGMVVRACIVLRAGHEACAATAHAIQEHVKATIAPYKYPRDVRFLVELPRTTSGKVERYKLRTI